MTVDKTTIYERVHFIYSRNETEFLSVRKQLCAEEDVKNLWDALQCKGEIVATELSCLTIRQLSNWTIFEKTLNRVIVGVVAKVFNPTTFDLWFVLTILRNAIISFPTDKFISGSIQSKIYAMQITEIFESSIKTTSRSDRWAEGRNAFSENVSFFTSKNIAVEAVLPAFPCKSSNFQKVASWTPDKGEELAISRVIEFVRKVNAIYPPGMKFYVVSDGHVFSDCINVDDEVVDLYTAQLVELYDRIKPEGFEGVYFRGLNDCFESSKKALVAKCLDSVRVDHPLETTLEQETETNRKILMLGCDNNADKLREQIKTPKHPRLYLYRGFNKFMHEDLINTPAAASLSKKKFKKLVSQVAFEMIRRNDAYSNLVELVFPFHLRLSIHAHHNAGPKYGIRLLDPNTCCLIHHNQDEEDRLLHVPTPWHNAIFRVDGESKFLVSAAQLAEQFENDNNYNGGWDKKERCFVYHKSK